MPSVLSTDEWLIKKKRKYVLAYFKYKGGLKMLSSIECLIHGQHIDL
jgi:hypothetical protein